MGWRSSVFSLHRGHGRFPVIAHDLVSVYDMAGRQVVIVIEGELAAGHRTVTCGGRSHVSGVFLRDDGY